MVHSLLKRAGNNTLLIALTKIDTSNFPKKFRHKLHPDLDLYMLYTYTPGQDACRLGHILLEYEVNAMHEAVRKLGKSPNFSTLDGTKCIVYECSKAELVQVL